MREKISEHKNEIKTGTFIFALGLIAGFRLCAKMNYYIVPPRMSFYY